MTAVSKTYTFVPGTPIESDQANQNFDDLVNYTNSEVIVRDASKAFTAIPSGPATNPTSDNQFARKKYVDDQDAALTAADTLRPQFVYGVAGISGTPTSPTQMKIVGGSYVGTTNAFGCIDVPISGLSNVATVLVCNGDTQNTNALTMAVRATIPSQVTVQVFHIAISPSQVLTYNSSSVRVNWIAIGW